MTTYDVLDQLADAYNPSLFIAYLIFSMIYVKAGDKWAWAKGLGGVAVAYVVMFVDKSTHWWASASLDYSTHSAVALALIVFHVHKRPLRHLSTQGFIGSLLAYYLLEIYQQYHTVSDIVSTVIVIGPLIGLVYWAMEKPRRVTR